MSDGKEDEADVSCCVSCGAAEIDDLKLKDCDGCDLVKYCSDECRELHRPDHAEKCRKRAVELRDELLFKQPESTHMGDCPICSLPLPLNMKKSSICYSCSKVICDGCCYAYAMREMEIRREKSCAFCRNPFPKTDEEGEKLRLKRIEANDPVAMRHEGWKQRQEGDYRAAFEYWTKAAELGSADAHYRLAVLYRNGHGVDQDEGKQIHHLEEAAIGGHPHARCGLGYNENRNGNVDRAVKHWIIAATQGEDESMECLIAAFKQGFVEKDVLAAALRAHKAAVDATKSPQRKVAEECS